MVADEDLSPLPGLFHAISYPGAYAPGYYLTAPPGLGRHIPRRVSPQKQISFKSWRFCDLEVVPSQLI
jgi:hypothetical protein